MSKVDLIVMSEEYFKHKFGEILGGVENPTPRTLAEIVERSGHSRATVLKWLGRLESEGLITRKLLIRGRGRPKFVYYPTQALLTPASGLAELVSVPFAELRKACKYQKSGFCKKAVQKCQLDDCPLVRG